MVIAALVSFGVLLLAWILAPERRAPTATVVKPVEQEALPAAA